MHFEQLQPGLNVPPAAPHLDDDDDDDDECECEGRSAKNAGTIATLMTAMARTPVYCAAAARTGRSPWRG